MSQVFPKSANYWSAGQLIRSFSLLLGLGWVILTLQRSDFVTTANQFIEQPVQFSHQHHVGGIGIDCRYCHTSVEVVAVGRHSADQDLHQLPLADLVDQPVPRAGARQLPRRQAAAAGSASTTCRTSCTSTTAST